MSATATQRVTTGYVGTESPRASTSVALEWLWQRLPEVANSHILDCGVLRRSTMSALLARSTKLYLTDVVSPLQQKKNFWDYGGNSPVFRTDRFLDQFPVIPRGSLSAILCWQLLDLLPREALAPVIVRMYLYLRPSGVLFCILREPWLNKGADWVWWLEGPATLHRDSGRSERFSYAALTNREMERLIPSGSAKTFLTRSGWREVLAVK